MPCFSSQHYNERRFAEKLPGPKKNFVGERNGWNKTENEALAEAAEASSNFPEIPFIRFFFTFYFSPRPALRGFSFSFLFFLHFPVPPYLSQNLSSIHPVCVAPASQPATSAAHFLARLAGTAGPNSFSSNPVWIIYVSECVGGFNQPGQLVFPFPSRARQSLSGPRWFYYLIS